MNAKQVLSELKSLADPKAVKGMARFGINPEKTLGVSIPALRKLAKRIGRNHALALGLWASGVHEARILAGFIDDPAAVTEKQMEEWARCFDSWDVCDQVCGSLFDKTPFAFSKAGEWASRNEEFVKRAGFAVIAWAAFHDKKAGDDVFLTFLPVIKRGSTDGRNFVKKAVNWALRQIGKRNARLNKAAIQAAKEIQRTDSKAAKWIASDALKELAGEAVKKRVARS